MYLTSSIRKEIGLSSIDIALGTIAGTVNILSSYINFWSIKISCKRLNDYWNSFEQLSKIDKVFDQNNCSPTGKHFKRLWNVSGIASPDIFSGSFKLYGFCFICVVLGSSVSLGSWLHGFQDETITFLREVSTPGLITFAFLGNFVANLFFFHPLCLTTEIFIAYQIKYLGSKFHLWTDLLKEIHETKKEKTFILINDIEK